MKVLWLRTPEAGADKNALVLDENGKIIIMFELLEIPIWVALDIDMLVQILGL